MIHILLKGLIILTLLKLIIFSEESFSQDTIDYKMQEEVLVIGRRPVLIENVNRSISLISKKDIEQTPVSTAQDLIQYTNSVDIRQRGTNGTQADINIRGGTFEQTLVLINGIKIIDPQTGHYNMNLPFSLESIERVEILRGEGSRIHGPNAFSGAVNFISRNDLSRGFSIGLSGGQNGYYSGSVSGSYNLGNWGNNISIEKLKSDGYKENTEFDITNFSYNSTLALSSSVMNLFFGLNEKDVGANNYYSTRFPLQADYTKTKFLLLGGEFGTGQFFVTPKLYWRRNNDEFVLNKYDPDFYRNLHQTDFYGGELQLSAKSELGVTTLGGEYTGDWIESTNLGNHTRSNKGIFLEQNFDQLEKISITVSGFAYDYSSIGWRVWPGIDAGYQITNELRAIAAIGKAFRIPTYTELYYVDPVTIGNASLVHEETVNYEAGISFKSIPTEINLNIFHKDGKDIIDWVRESEQDLWRAENITATYTNGVEVNLSITPEFFIKNTPVSKINLSYTYLNSDRKKSEYESRYVLDYLKHQLILNLTHSFFYDINFNWFLRYEKRIGFEENFITDLNVRKEISYLDLYIKVTNLFNVYYEDVAGIELPGRWVVGGLRFAIQRL